LFPSPRHHANAPRLRRNPDAIAPVARACAAG
jgi:hypothetical protein